MKLVRLILLGVLVSVIPFQGRAQDAVDITTERVSGASDESRDSVRLGRVVVTATKTEIRETETGASVTVITEDEIQSRGKRYVVDLLKEVPGVTVSRSGNISYIYLRGANHGNTMVLIDGMPANDPISDSKSFDFSHLVTDNIERIEIIRGPQSTLYGSEASGGVINIITKKGKGKTALTVTAETGSPRSYHESVALQGKIKNVDYSLAVSRIDRGGYSSVSEDPTKTSGLEDDDYSNTALSSRLGLDLPWNMTLENSLLFSYAAFDIDDWASDDDINRRDSQRTILAVTSLKHAPFTVWDHTITVGYNGIRRTDEDDVDAVEPADTVTDTWFHGQEVKTEWQNNFYIGKIDTVTAGIDFMHEGGEFYTRYGAGPATEFDKGAWNMNGYILNHLKMWDRLFFTAGMRYIYHKEFNSRITWQTSLSYIVPVTGTRLRGCYGTGFKAPTLYQLYVNDSWVTGNPDLDPEKSSGFEAGLEQDLFNGHLEIMATYFDTRYSEMISAVEVALWTYEYANTGKAWCRGAETTAKLKLPYDLSLTGSYTFTASEDRSTGDDLFKRPRHKTSAGLDWKYPENGNLGIVFNYTGDQKVSASESLGDYYTLDVSASYWLTKWLQAFIRIENITDNDYVEYGGYSTPGISVFFGLKGRLECGEEDAKNNAVQ